MRLAFKNRESSPVKSGATVNYEPDKIWHDMESSLDAHSSTRLNVKYSPFLVSIAFVRSFITPAEN